MEVGRKSVIYTGACPVLASKRPDPFPSLPLTRPAPLTPQADGKLRAPLETRFMDNGSVMGSPLKTNAAVAQPPAISP